jgi:hypothetical protein
MSLYDFLTERCVNDWDYNRLSSFNITIKEVLSNPEKEWNWRRLSLNKCILLEDKLRTPHLS